MRVLANWLYGIQILSLNMNENSRFLVYKDGNFKTSCLAVSKCRSAMMRLYVVKIGSLATMDSQRCVKIGYYDKHPDGNETKYFLAANKEDNYEVSATEDFDTATLFNLTIFNATTLECTLFDSVSQRYLQAKSIPPCGVGKLIMVDAKDPKMNNSIFKIYTRRDEYFDRDLSCC